MNTHRIAQHLIDTRQDIQFYYTGTEQCTPGHSWGPGLKDHYKIHYIHSGQGIYRSGEETYRLGKGCAFLMTPDRVAYYQADRNNPWSYSWVAFNGSQARAYLEQAGLTAEHPVITCNKDPEIRQCLNRLFDANQQYYSKPLQMSSALYAFLALILESAAPASAGSAGSRAKSAYVDQAINFMELNYSRSITMEELAHALGLNRKYIASLFKTDVGVPPQQYLCRLRMNKACELLSGTTLTIKEIAYSVGYADQLLFSRMFKKTIGVTPSQYRTSPA